MSSMFSHQPLNEWNTSRVMYTSRHVCICPHIPPTDRQLGPKCSFGLPSSSFGEHKWFLVFMHTPVRERIFQAFFKEASPKSSTHPFEKCLENTFPNVRSAFPVASSHIFVWGSRRQLIPVFDKPAFSPLWRTKKVALSALGRNEYEKR